MVTKVKNRVSKNGHSNGSVEELIPKRAKKSAASLPVAQDAPAKNGKEAAVTITPPRMQIVKVRIRGTAPYMQLRFPEKARNTMIETHKAGSQAKSKKKRDARDFEADYKQAFHRLPNGDAGIPCASIRSSMISACRTAGFVMEQAKQAVWCLHDGLDVVDGAALVKIHGKPRQTIMPVRNSGGKTDLRVRPQWDEWHADLRLRVNLDVMSVSDAINLLARAGMLVGIGEGRIGGTKQGYGMGLGSFEVEMCD